MRKISPEEKKRFEELLDIKKSPSKYESQLLKKAYSYEKILSCTPGILCVCVCNSLALNTAHKDSDIDILVISKPHRIWTTRICMTIMMALLGQRKTSKKHAGKFCLSFFISADNLDIGDIALKNDIYLHYWMHSLIPIVNKNQTFEKFQTKNAYWTEYEKHHDFGKKSIGEDDNKHILENICDMFETLLKNIFLPRTLRHYAELGKPVGIIITDTMLKFHNNDEREKIRDSIYKK